MKHKLDIVLPVLFIFTACQQEIENPGVPVQTGDEIDFGVSKDNDEVNIVSRTSYGNVTNTGQEINWVYGDKIAIYCGEASAPDDKTVIYSITPDTETPSVASRVDKLEEIGLQWGTVNEHEFYAFYPGDKMEKIESGKIYASVESNQQVLSWKEEASDYGGKKYVGEPDMTRAFMYAHELVKKNEVTDMNPVNLEFHPMVTVLEITVNGPKEGNPIKVTNINISGAEDDILTGKFYCDLQSSTATDEIGKCYPVDEGSKIRNTISITCFNKDTNDFIELGIGDQLQVKAFFIPDDENNPIEPRNLKISVSPMNKANLDKTLGGVGSSGGSVEPHKLNRVYLPYLIQTSTNYWMTSIPSDNVYMTELSIPGSKFTNDKNYQPVDHVQQFKDGVRAFVIGTQLNSNGKVTIDNYDGDLRKFISTIASEIEKAETELINKGKNSKEFAVIMLTKSSGGGSDKWLQTISQEINDLSKDGSLRIYTGDFNAGTTIGDVKGQIILKINVNTDLSQPQYASNVPALFSLWDGVYGPEQNSGTYYQDNYYGMPLYWKKYENFDINSSGNTDLRWYYQEATYIGNNGEATDSQKKEFIRELFSTSVDLYKKGQHNTWFMNDLGGTHYDHNSGTWTSEDGKYHIDYSNGIEYVAADLNFLAVEELQNRSENAALGLIFMNFANAQTSGQKFRSDYIIQTIIDNNFKFELNQRPTSGRSRVSVSTTNSNPDEWDN